jgi:hypothetical protein
MDTDEKQGLLAFRHHTEAAGQGTEFKLLFARYSSRGIKILGG